MKKDAKNLGRVSSNYLYLKNLSAAGWSSNKFSASPSF